MKNFLVILIIISLNFVDSSPISALTHRDEIKNRLRGYNSEKLISFMQTYGYLQQPNDLHEGLQAEFLYAEDAIIDGIKDIQRFGGIEPTGILNDATIKLMSSPRCGVKDIQSASERRKRYIIGAENWKKRKITYYIANFNYKVGENETYEAIEKAFEAWSIYSRLIFKRVYDNSADIVIAFGSGYHGDRYPFDGAGNILAHAFYPYEENSWGGDIHFDNDENWKEGSENLIEGVDFLTVATHEIGHSLGLAHSPVYNAIMFPYYKGLAYQLEYDDILGMYQLYITRTLEENSDDAIQNPVTESFEEVEVTTAIASEEIEETTIDFEEPPNICEGNFDSLGIVDNFLYIIKTDFIWQLNKNFTISSDYPKRVEHVFPNLPKRFRKIDAFYQSSDGGEVVIFSGREYITYDPRGPIYMAYNLTRYTLDEDILKINAAMVWSKNNKIYLFSSDRYWRFSESRKMDHFYPRIIKTWRGVPAEITGAISFKNGPTVFFKNDEFIVYNDAKVKPKAGYPKKIRELLPYCS